MTRVRAIVMFVLGSIVALPAGASAANSDFAKLCQKGGWTHVVRADGTPFASEDACVSYGAHGGKLGQTITFTSANPSPVTVGGPTYAPTATSTSGLAVAITLDATSTGCSLSSGVVSFTAGGTCVIDANQAGNGVWAAAPQRQQLITVNKKPQTITFTSTNPSPVTALDGTYTPTAIATSGLTVAITLDATSTGCSLSSGVVSFPASGTCVINANQAGNGVWATAPQKQQSITINKKSQTITFTSTNPSPVTVDGPTYTPTATATSALTVAFTLDATSTGCSLSSGVVSFTTSGTCVIDANQAGNGTWAAASQQQQSITVNKKSQTITYTSTNPSPVVVGLSSYTPTATATSGLTVVITLDATSTGCSLSSGVVSFTAAGTCVIDANQAGNGTWAAASQVQQSITVDACISTDAQLRAAAAAGGSYCLAPLVPLTGGEVVVGSTLSLTSAGQTNATVDAQQNSRVFNVTLTGQLTLNNVTVTGGEIKGLGGGIYVAGSYATPGHGSVILNGTTSVTGNTAQNGGGVHLEGSFTVGGTLTMNDSSSITANSADPLGDNITTSAGGVRLELKAVLTMNGTSSVSNNQVGGGAVSLGGGVLNNVGQITLNGSSSISNNRALVSSFANESLGGGVYFVNGGSLTLNGSSAITGNSAVNTGGGIYRIDGGFGTISGVTAANVAGNTPNNCAGPAAVPGCVN